MPQQSGWPLPNEVCALDTESKPMSLCTHSYFGLPPSHLARSFESLSTIKTGCRTSKKHLAIYCQVYMFLLSPSDTIYLYRIMCFSIDRQRLQPPLLGTLFKVNMTVFIVYMVNFSFLKPFQIIFEQSFFQQTLLATLRQNMIIKNFPSVNRHHKQITKSRV